MSRVIRFVAADDPFGSIAQLLPALDGAGIVTVVVHVRSRRELIAALDEQPCDLVVVSGLHPERLADDACQLASRDAVDLPVIVVVPGETSPGDTAIVRAVRAGARDYVGSEESARFVAAVERELRRARHDRLRLQGLDKMQAIGRLAGGIAHDFNNLLQTIGGYSEVLLGRLSGSDALRGPAREINKAATRAATLTRQLLAFSRQQVMQPRVLDLNRVISQAEPLLRRAAEEHVDLRFDLAVDLGGIRADASQLEQVLLNLAVNAREAMPRGGRLIFETAKETLTSSVARLPFVVTPGPYVRLSVIDTGCGMTPDVRARAFEPFFTTKPRNLGSGLGLSTVYGIVKQSGGFIWIDSAPGQGSRVRIYLPHVAMVDAPERDRPHQVHALPTASTLLVVEDEPEVRQLVQEWLEAHGYRVLSARDGLDALEIAASYEGPIDCMVSDVVMPLMDGPAVAQHLLPKRPSLKVIYMSAYTGELPGEPMCPETGAAFLQKPFTLDVLVRTVRDVLQTVS